jgi:predicted RNA-binding protein with TRAM domain
MVIKEEFKVCVFETIIKKQVLTIMFIIGITLLSCNKEENNLTNPIPTEINAGYKFTKIPNNGQDSLTVAIWYPTLDNESEYNYNTASSGLTVRGKVSYNAAEINENHPVVIFSHGFSGGGIASVEICEALARAGFYVFVPDHNDPVMAVRIQGQANGTLDEALEYLTNNPFGNGDNYLYRITELQSALDFVNASNFKIDKSKIILSGHSMGGWTVMKVMEGGVNPTAMFFFSMGELNWLHSQSRYFEASTFQDIDFPTAYFYGGIEYGQAISAGLGNVYAAYCFTYSPSPSYGLLVKQGNHFTYNSEAVAPGSFGTNVQINSINDRLINFLKRHVKGQNVVVTSEPEDVIK